MVDSNSSGKQEVPKEARKLADSEMRERVHTLEERVILLAKFTIKVTYVVATTLYLLKENHEGDLTNEDSRMFNLLAEDWAKIILKGKDDKKPN